MSAAAARCSFARPDTKGPSRSSRGWLARSPRRWQHHAATRGFRQPAVRRRLVAIVALLVAVVSVGLIISITRQHQGRASLTPTGNASNGLIAYSYDGDIYVGDPLTGETAAIVTNPAYEVNPVFSPDGERIAFIRGDPQTKDSTIVVVRADGSDERVILPKGREHRGFVVLAWTPDGDSLVAQLDTPPFTFPHDDGEVSLFDSFGAGDEQLLAPPLPTEVGVHYFSTDAEVAPMFRPPKGDRILSGENKLDVLDADFATVAHLAKLADLETVALTAATRLGPETRERYESVWAAVADVVSRRSQDPVPTRPSSTRDSASSLTVAAS